MSLGVGSIVDGRYRITGTLGEGGMGTVYRAEQINLRRPVALKVLLAKYAAQPEALRRFEREARVAATLRHPGAVEIYDVGVERGQAFIAMEMLRGCELRELLPEGIPVPLPQVLAMAQSLADVLVAAHAVPIVHRDLKPENIFVIDRDLAANDIKVVDFGLAFIAGVDELGRMTQEGQVVGTPAYLSPEQAEGRRIGPASDVYSLGCVLYELATGWPPFVGNWMNVVTQHLYVTATPPRERALSAGIPGDLDALIMSMMAKQEDARPSIGEVRVALSSVAGTLTGARHRGRGDELLADRKARMISVPSADAPPESSTLVAAAADLVVGFVGGVSDALAVALASNGIGIEAVELETELPVGVAAIVLRQGAVGAAELAVGHGLPVVAIIDTENLELIAELLRAGVMDVVAQPAQVDDVVRKVRRAVARHRRKSLRGQES
ncbi:MAG: serine/threonine-protein kinase [Myxococcota bacterium]